MMKKYYTHIALIATTAAILLGACGPAARNSTPTFTPLSAEGVYTAAAQTVFAALTQQSIFTQPAATFTGIPTATATPTTFYPTSPYIIPTAATCANSSFISDVTIPDGTQLPVNYAFTKTWRVKNTGTCAWTTSFKLVFVRGEAMGGLPVSLPASVSIGGQVDISVKLKVPNKTGKLTGVWVLVDDKGQHFGELITVVINIGALSPTPTGSVTVTPTRTPTRTVSSTPTRTPSTTPTLTPTPSISITPSETPTESITPTPSLTTVPSETPTEIPTETATETPTPTT
jgi:hypothetical protein